MVRGAWCLVRGAWCLVHGVWCLVRGAWCMVHGAWCLVLGKEREKNKKMETGKSYIEMDVWKESMKLVRTIYDVTRTFPKEEIYCLTNQMRRAAISIPSNIAEGIGRNHAKDTIQFLFVSRGSIYELETQLFVAIQQDYIQENEVESIFRQFESCKKLINGLINYYKKKLS